MAGYASRSFLEIRRQPITVEKESENTDSNTTAKTASLQDGISQNAQDALTAEKVTFFASKNGKVYYLPWCLKQGQISDKNKVEFATRKEAEAAGLKPAASCPEISLF